LDGQPLAQIVSQTLIIAGGDEQGYIEALRRARGEVV